MEPATDLLVPAPPHPPMTAERATLLYTALRLQLPFPLRGHHSMKRFAFPVTSPVEELGEIERPVDRVICYMKKFNLKYGFLTTYRVTVFIRRVENYKFEVPPPVDYRATQSSLRECFTAFTALADDDLVY